MARITSFERLLARFCRVQALAVLVAAALAYPLALNTNVLLDWIRRVLPERLQNPFIHQFESILTFGLSPLTLKETLVCCGICALALSFVVWRAVWPDKHCADSRRLYAITALLALATVSAVWQSPTFYVSFKTLTRVACVSAYYFIVASLARERGFLRQGAILILILSAILSIVSLLQHLGVSRGVMVEIPDMRNRIGSLIGHNTGLSCYLMMALFIAVSFLFGRASAAAKIAAGCLAILLSYVLVIAQSRGVWMAILILLPFFLHRLARLTGVAPRLKHWAVAGAAALAILASQLIQSPVNVLNVQGYPLARRLKDFSPDAIRRETRTRVLFCSVGLVLRSPLIGYGLGSFRHVYPEAQMRYYESHPTLWIEPTQKRSTHAHNEYLQLSIETGLIGCVLVLGFLFLEARGGLRVQRLALETDPRGEAVRYGAGFAVLSFALHAALDFPVHVIPLSTTAAFLFAAWTGAPAPGRQEAPQPAPGPPHETVRRTGAAIAATILTAAALALSVGGFCLFGRELVADSYFVDGLRNYGTLFKQYASATDEQRLMMLGWVSKYYERASALEPLDMETVNERAQALELMGQVETRRMKDAQDAKDARAAALWRARAIQDLKLAADLAERAREEFRNHVNYAIAGGSYNRLYDLTNDEEYYRRARENLELAVRYSPSYNEGLRELSELYAGRNPERAARLRAQMEHYDPVYYAAHYIEKAERLRYNIRFQEALPLFRSLVAVEEVNRDTSPLTPEARRVYYGYLATLLDAGQREEAQTALQRIRPRIADPWELAKLQARFLALDGKWTDLLELTRQIRAHNSAPGENSFWETLEASLISKLRVPEANERIAEIRRKAQKDISYQMHLGLIAADWFNDRETAIKELTICSRMQPPPHEFVFARLALLLFEEKRYDEARVQAEAALKRDPNFERMQDLLKELNSLGR